MNKASGSHKAGVIIITTHAGQQCWECTLETWIHVQERERMGQSQKTCAVVQVQKM